MSPIRKITVQDTEISILTGKGDDFICLTDMARFKGSEPSLVILWLFIGDSAMFMPPASDLHSHNS